MGQDVVNDYRTTGNVTFATATNWERCSVAGAPGTWVAAVAAPTAAAANVITIRNTHIATVDANISLDQLVVATGGELSVSAAVTLTVAAGAGTDLTVDGTVNNSGTITPTGTISFRANSTYNHTRDGGAIPTSTWAANSNCNITGITVTAPGGTIQTFGNFTWDCAAQNAILNLTTGAVTFTATGDLYVKNTNNQTLGFTNSNNNTTLRIYGDLNVGDGTNTTIFNLKRNNNNNNNTVEIGGDITVNTNATLTKTGTGTSASVNFGFAGATATSSVNWGGTGTYTNTYINYIIQNIPAGKIVTLTRAMTIPAGRSITFTNGTLFCETNVISGAGTFNLSAGATIGIGDTNGINTAGATGNVQTTTRTYSSVANYIYNGSIAQSTGTFTTAPTANTVNNLTINNTGTPNTVTLNSSLTVSGILTLNSGVLSIGANNITLANGATLAGNP